MGEPRFTNKIVLDIKMLDFIKNIDFAFKNWDFARIIRLVMGLFFGISAIMDKDYFVMLIAGVLLYQAIANTGCGFTKGSNSCSIDPPQKSNHKVKF